MEENVKLKTLDELFSLSLAELQAYLEEASIDVLRMHHESMTGSDARKLGRSVMIRDLTREIPETARFRRIANKGK